MCHKCKFFTAEEAYSGVLALDATMVKAVKVSEIAQIARSEIRLRNFLLKSWKETTDSAIKKASAEIQKKTTKKKIISLIEKEMNTWENATEGVFEKEITNTYRLGKIAGTKRANGKKTKTGYGKKEIKSIAKANTFDITFTEEDEAAIRTLLEHQLYWVGDFYDDNLSEAISQIVEETIEEQGFGTVLSGKILSENLAEAFGYINVPDGYNGTASSILRAWQQIQ